MHPSASDSSGGAERLARIEALLEIQQLKARYAELVDARTVAGRVVDDAELARLATEAAALFTEDATWDGGAALGVARGRREITDRLRRPTIGFGLHVFTQPRIDLAGDLASATGRWTLLSPHTGSDGTSAWLLGEEHDTYRRVDGRWLHATMRLRVIALAPVPQGWGRILS